MQTSLMSLRKRLGAVLFVLLLSAAVHAQITPTDDSYVDTNTPTVNFGSKPTLEVASPSQTIYITFDLSSIPSGFNGSTVAKASVKLYVNSVTTAGSLNVDYVNGAWTEKTISANNAPPPGSTIAASVPLAKTQAHDYVLIDITSAVVAWLNRTEPNDGIALVANSPLSATFDSKESTTQSHPPELDIVFASGGGGGTITGVLTGANSGLTGGGTSGTLNVSLLTSCASKQVLAWTGSAWTCSSAGTGTITGVTAGTDLTGGGTSGNVALNLNLPALDARYAQLATANTFTGNQTVNGNVSATGLVTGSAYNIGSALFAFGSASASNAFLGFAGNTTTTGTSNTATGSDALFGNTTGTYNTATGADALLRNTTGSSNTASGLSSLAENTTGGYNTASGVGALLFNNTGSGNTGIGSDAGNSVDGSALGNYNTAVGTNSAFGTGSISNATAIGAFADVTASNSLVLGSINGKNGAPADTNVGIGTTAPTARLHIGNSGTSNPTGLRIEGPLKPGTGALAASLGGYGDFDIDAFGVIGGRFSVKENGDVTIGNTAASHILTIQQGLGPAFADAWMTWSSRRWKTNIQPLHGALAKVERLRGVSYDLKDSGRHQIGVIAEEVGAVVPEVVTWENNGKDAQGVDYARLTALLIEATKEQQALIHQQQEQIEAQQAQMTHQEARIGQLARQVQAVQTSLKPSSRADSEIRRVSTSPSPMCQ